MEKIDDLTEAKVWVLNSTCDYHKIKIQLIFWVLIVLIIHLQNTVVYDSCGQDQEPLFYHELLWNIWEWRLFKTAAINCIFAFERVVSSLICLYVVPSAALFFRSSHLTIVLHHIPFLTQLGIEAAALEL